MCCAGCSCCGNEPPPPFDCEEYGVRDTAGEVILDAYGECLLDLGKFP